MSDATKLADLKNKWQDTVQSGCITTTTTPITTTTTGIPAYSAPAPCPSCGACPTCGRGAYQTRPYWQPYPYYPYYHNGYWWGGNSNGSGIPWTNGIGQTGTLSSDTYTNSSLPSDPSKAI